MEQWFSNSSSESPRGLVQRERLVPVPELWILWPGLGSRISTLPRSQMTLTILFWRLPCENCWCRWRLCVQTLKLSCLISRMGSHQFSRYCVNRNIYTSDLYPWYCVPWGLPGTFNPLCFSFLIEDEHTNSYPIQLLGVKWDNTWKVYRMVSDTVNTTSE